MDYLRQLWIGILGAGLLWLPALDAHALDAIDYQGQQRPYRVFAPQNHDSKPLPLLIALHGGNGDGKLLIDIASDLNSYAGSHGVMVVYPDGTGEKGSRLLNWNAGTCCGGAMERKVDDVGYIRALIGTLESRYNIDKSRIFVAGLSNGALLAYKLGCELSDVLSGIASVAGAMDMECAPAHPLSVILFHGTADSHVLYEGGNSPHPTDNKHPRIDRPVKYAVDFWTRYDHCSAEPQKHTQGHIVQDSYAGCDRDTSVTLYTVVGGEHAWPGGRANGNGPEPTHEISASAAIVDFLLAHPKEK